MPRKEKLIRITEPPAPQIPDPSPICPTLFLRADKRFDLLSLIAIVRLAREWKLPPDRLAPLEKTLRDFELYEETCRP